nr:hypothetical protein [Tanacetum cinerariifolium]
WEKTTIAVRKIESISSKKTKEMPKQKPEYVMDAVNGNIEGVCFACGPGGKEGRSLFAPVELCYVTLYWSMIHKQRV